MNPESAPKKPSRDGAPEPGTADEQPAEGARRTTVVEGQDEQSASRRRPGGARSVMVCLLIPALAFATTLFTWVHAKVPTVLQQGTTAIDVKGTDAAPAVSALAIVAVAGVLAARIAGTWLRAVICAVVALAGAGIGIAALTSALNPEQASTTKVGKATGTIGGGGSFETTVWPWLALVLAVATVVMAVWLWFSSRRWRSTARRYDRNAVQGQAPGENPHGDDIDAWDSLTAGQDPTA